MAKIVAKVWEFGSSSNPAKKYETLQYTDETISCNCPGWTRRVDAQGNRSCKHTRSVDMGTADSDCLNSHDYAQTQPKKAPPVQAKPKVKKSKPVSEIGPTVRRIQWK